MRHSPSRSISIMPWLTFHQRRRRHQLWPLGFRPDAIAEQFHPAPVVQLPKCYSRNARTQFGRRGNQPFLPCPRASVPLPRLPRRDHPLPRPRLPKGPLRLLKSNKAAFTYKHLPAAPRIVVSQRGRRSRPRAIAIKEGIAGASWLTPPMCALDTALSDSKLFAG